MHKQTFTKKDGCHTFTAEAYTTDGKVWRWTSNNQVAPVDACKEYKIPCDEQAQQEAKTKEIDKFLAEYRKNAQPPTPEEIAEARAAYGPNKDIVDVITGHKFRT